MEKLKIDFKKDITNGLDIPIEEIRKEMKEIKQKNYYLSEIAEYYYKKTYNKNILEILDDFYEIPRCPATNHFVSYKLNGSIVFGKYGPLIYAKEIGLYVSENDEKYKNFVEKMKTERKGSGNPMYKAIPWNKNLTKEEDDRVMSSSKKRIGLKHSDESKKKQSESAKKRTIHGHSGHKHSEESKQIMREKTILRFKSGSFPQTNSFPHREVKKILENICIEENLTFEEEFEYGGFVFDFKFENNLIEVQGDYFHCNPNTRHKVPKNKMQINNLERDERKKDFVYNKKEYNFVEIWEFDIVNNIKKVEQCLKNLKK